MYKKYFILFLLFLFPFLLNATEIKIASYNVENLFDMLNNGTEYDEYKPHKHNWTRRNLQKKILNISDVICDINADIIGLQEVENLNVLKLLQKSLRKVGCSYGYVAITHKKNSAIQVAVLSKIPMSASKEIVVSRKRGHRHILEVKFMLDNNAFFVYVNHWNSKRSAESSRIKSARVLAKRLKQLSKGQDYILLGDFNSNYNEYKNIEKKHNDRHGQTGINHVLKTLIQNKMVQEKDMHSKAFLHYNLWLELANFQRWSHNFFGKKQGLDAIILPSSMFDGKGLDYVNDSFKVLNASYLFHKKGYIYRWQYRGKKHVGKGYSDHLPVMATFSTAPYKADSNRMKVKEGLIKELYQASLTHSLLLKQVKVIFKSKHHAVIKQTSQGRAIFVYGAEGLEEGKEYDLLVHKLKNYYGLHEVIDFSISKAYAKVDISDYFYKGKLDFTNIKLENEVVKDLDGLYKNNSFYIKGKAFKIFFRNKHLRPKNGTYLKLHRVQIGYYKNLQLVVWSAEDFSILE